MKTSKVVKIFPLGFLVKKTLSKPNFHVRNEDFEKSLPSILLKALKLSFNFIETIYWFVYLSNKIVSFNIFKI